MRIKLIGLNARYTHSCLALFYVRNELAMRLGNECQTTIEQYTINDPYHELFLHISEGVVQFYFFSAYIWNSDLIERIIGDLLRLDARCYCVVGGPQAEVVANQMNMSRCISVVGEVERVGEDFYGHLQSGALQQKYESQKGPGAFSFPYHESDYSEQLSNRHIYYESSRGCPFNCTYCLSSFQQGIFRKSLAVVKKELYSILCHQPRVIRFVDRTFNDRADRALEIWRFLAEQDGPTTFHFEISPDRFTEEMFSFLETVPTGRFQFEIGIQSTHRRTLEAIRRPIDVEQAAVIVKRLAAMGNIHLHVDLILGLPYDNEISYYSSFRDVFAMEPHYIQMGLLKILPDTPICQTARDDGVVHSSVTPYSVYANRWLTFEQVKELYWFNECVEKFYNNRYFSSLWHYLREGGEDIEAYCKKLLKVCLANDFFHRAPTHEFLLSLLLQANQGRKDYELIVELLRFDWLRCGHRFLAKSLQVDGESRQIKKELYRNTEAIHTSLENTAETHRYLKKGFVVPFSPSLLRTVGVAFFEQIDAAHFLCFVSERDSTLWKYNKFALFSLPGGEVGS